MTLAEYKTEIKKATTKEELRQIAYKVFLEDDDALKGKQSIYDKVINLCIKREEELGLS